MQLCILFNEGADRTARLDGKTILELITSAGKTAISWRAKGRRRMIALLRTYAPDLKTRTALAILNQVRQGTISASPIQERLNYEGAIELIAELVSADKESEAAWIAYGMPYLERAEVYII